MKTKIIVILLISAIILGCNSTKRVADKSHLLFDTEIIVDNKKEKSEEFKNVLTQKPNAKILNLPLKLYVFNWAKPNSDSLFQEKIKNNPEKYDKWKKWLSEKQLDIYSRSFFKKGVHDFLRKNGSEPVIFDERKAKTSTKELKNYLNNIGYPKAEISYKIDTIGDKKIKTTYNIIKNTAYTLDTLTHNISSPQLDSIYTNIKNNSILRKGEVFKVANFESEKNRLTNYFRNNGFYEFQPTFIGFVLDSIGTKNKFNVITRIKDFSERIQDTTFTRPFEIYKIKEINVFTDSPNNKVSKTLQNKITHNGINIYSKEKLNFKPQTIANAVFLEKGQLYSDFFKTLTGRAFYNLDQFNAVSIQYIKDEKTKELTANIFMEQKKKFQFNNAIDFTHSNIQDIGVNLSISTTLRNVFKGAETLNIALRGNIASSNELANPKNVFFNVNEYGIDTKLNVPKILFPTNIISRLIPKTMLPTTTISLGFSKQENIGLDKQSFVGSFNYNWAPKKNHAYRVELFNIQYIKNVNPQNYFNIYRRSYDALNSISANYRNYLTANNALDVNNNLIIDSGTDFFINNAVNGQVPFLDNSTLTEIKSIRERKFRLTENNLIFSSAVNYNFTSRNNLTDNNFYNIKAKVESAGNFLSLFAKNTTTEIKDSKQIFDIVYSQFFKTELEYVKYFDLKSNNILAFRAFGGVAIPYGNSSNIPFNRSYFAGGTNDIRAWQPYRLGPGSSGSLNNFNEANLKLLFNLEYRYKIFGNLKGALFIDAGNIWNVLDDIKDDKYVFKNLKSLEDIAVGTGTGLRYDFSLVILRFDFGVKTYNPVLEKNQRWFKNLNLEETVFNIGINYPF